MIRSPVPTRREVFFPSEDIIVSKTDVKGRITYANETFCQIAGYGERELIGQPHSIIRHPDMPRAVFKLLWDMLAERQEVFAYVKNMARSGDFYWVFAHVTPSLGRDGKLVGYHSSRRVPDRRVVDTVIAPFYASVLRAEQSHRNGKEALAAGFQCLADLVTAKKTPYEELIFAL
jgi:PAS domain S-box-containing protein